MFQKILIVCVGNICRSPTAERLLQQKMPHLQVFSAGLKAAAGKDADLQAIRTALRHGLIIAGHTARPLTAAMCETADLILVMEPRHIDEVAAVLPAARSKTMLLGQWLPKQHIPDPYGQSDEMFEAVYRLIDEAVEQWAFRLTVRP
ncbi:MULTISPECIES: low molecular weight protein-tyrosine-phosphatase [Neisseria]|uniref:protein-tyrosine-phosphatase n=1 Tax=Neisseria musculi TaxID=1815583 RepID=A0A7H1MF28_9NEIS|nr:MULTISPECIES: low molecular weight protein-tyrosine-phosphatase [Neisseria]MBF0804002.1 low molecular weight phosphotyrosine protein phosphatase [Neisseria sp. 19428wB4_WF04]QNT60243.1 low molecular weight phosphotyrosine phosphatase family protein [Neisseria musculi]TFU43272.1 low molecular weight phosphotyrosine protein phosphatase [Neisseria sp. WF04]